jgi:hypothetical protein
MGSFQIAVYNSAALWLFIEESILFTVISAFIGIIVLMTVHLSLEFMKKQPQNGLAYVFYTFSETWMVAYIMVLL